MNNCDDSFLSNDANIKKKSSAEFLDSVIEIQLLLFKLIEAVSCQNSYLNLCPLTYHHLFAEITSQSRLNVLQSECNDHEKKQEVLIDRKGDKSLAWLK